jgi:cob(I)alamin adenosyltransferase
MHPVIIVYTGEGKGKTSACVGQAVRARGHGMAVAFAQFMKRPHQAGEQRLLAELLGERFYAGGIGFLRRSEGFPAHRAAAQTTLAWAHAQVDSGCQVLVLDEAVYALGYGLLERSELEAVLDAARAAACHVVLSGRGAPSWLVARAHIVTEMLPLRHAYAEGVAAQAGVEF